MAKKDSSTYNVVLIGAPFVGKTTLVQRYLSDEFTYEYVATSGLDLHQLKFDTNHGKINLDLWDIAGYNKSGRSDESYYDGAHGAIVMFALTSTSSYQQTEKWMRRFHENAPEASIVLCGNKVETKDRRVSIEDITLHRELGEEFGQEISYLDLSVKTGQNIEEPFLAVLRLITTPI